MNEIKFSEIWRGIIKPLLDWKLSKDSHLYSLRDINAPNSFGGMELRYNSLRDGIKKNFMKQIDGRLDRHKICACVCIAIMERPMLTVTNGTAEKNAFANAWVAFLASCRILYSFMRDDAKSNPGFEKFLKEREILCFPEDGDSGESYLTQTLKFLCYAKEQNELSALALANIFCLLEDRAKLVYKSASPVSMTV
jgi:hypothetical protein